jgi:transglutaminase-like putative cysteine protease
VVVAADNAFEFKMKSPLMMIRSDRVMPDLTNRVDYLASTEVVDWNHSDIRKLASDLASGESGSTAIAQKCFEWVRDEIQHSMDFSRSELTCTASEVLKHRTGFCYAKSHLLAALLRANKIPAGFCYQRLSIDGIGPPLSLHGLNAVWLDNCGWYRIDSRGNKSGVDAEFSPPIERLAFPIELPGETDLQGVYSKPLPVIIAALKRYDTASELAKNLPDLATEECQRALRECD